MNCCTNCFKDEFLIGHIRANADVDLCDYCSTEPAQVIDPSQLREYFERFLSLYYPDPDGDVGGVSLAFLIQAFWNIFSDDFDDETLDDLVDEIFNGQLLPNRREFRALPVQATWVEGDESQLDNLWSRFATHLRTKRRFVVDWREIPGIADPVEW